MNLPNGLTIARIFFVPLLVAVLLQEQIILHWRGAVITNDVIALIIFWVAAATDLLDGYLARRWKQVTTIGTLLDPIADKLLVSAALISLVQVGVIRSWLVVLLVGREFAVSGLRSIAAAEGYTIQANELGKTKTFFQVVAISFLLLSIRHTEASRWATISLYVVVFFSVVSAITYFAKFWRKVDISIKQRRRAELLDGERLLRREFVAKRRAAVAERRRMKASLPKADRVPTREFADRAADLPPSA